MSFSSLLLVFTMMIAAVSFIRADSLLISSQEPCKSCRAEYDCVSLETRSLIFECLQYCECDFRVKISKRNRPNTFALRNRKDPETQPEPEPAPEPAPESNSQPQEFRPESFLKGIIHNNSKVSEIKTRVDKAAKNIANAAQSCSTCLNEKCTQESRTERLDCYARCCPEMASPEKALAMF